MTPLQIGEERLRRADPQRTLQEKPAAALVEVTEAQQTHERAALEAHESDTGVKALKAASARRLDTALQPRRTYGRRQCCGEATRRPEQPSRPRRNVRSRKR